MIEIVCPSCGAQYKVPDDSIGPEGRKVTCSNCSHKWRAYREAAGAEAAAPAGAAGAGAAAEWHAPAASRDAAETRPAETAAGEAGDGETPAEPAAEEPATTSPADMPPGEPPRAGGREEQMDAIRRMLDDLKRNSEDEPEPQPEPEARRQTARPEPSRSRYSDDEDLEDGNVDPLKSRISQMDKSGKAERPSNYDAAKLRRMHEKRAKRLQRAKERQRKSGAFVTGFTLVGVVTAAMVMLYVMHPQIIASQPQLEPAMNDYVVTVDRYRLALDEATAGWQAWVQENVGPLLGSAEEALSSDTEEPSAEEPAASQ